MKLSYSDFEKFEDKKLKISSLFFSVLILLFSIIFSTLILNLAMAQPAIPNLLNSFKYLEL